MVPLRLLIVGVCFSVVSAVTTTHKTTSTSKHTSTSTHKSSTTSSSIKTTSHSTSISSTKVPATTTAPPPPVVTVGQYGQCGGQGFTGPTTCPTDWICTVNNQFFSQCLPGPNYTPPPPPPPSTTTSTFIPQQTWDYVISFGDSWTATGFDITGTKPSPANPLGNTFPTYTWNWINYLIQFNPGLLFYNFASAGSTISSSITPPTTPGALDLAAQIAQFTTHMVPPPDYAPWYYNSTLFIIWAGNSDVIAGWNTSSWADTTAKLLASYEVQVQNLWDAGARSFLFVDIPTIDRMPFMLRTSAADQATMRSAISTFNSGLSDLSTNLANANCWTDQYPNYAAGSPCFALYTLADYGWGVVLDEAIAAGEDVECVNAGGEACFWVDERTPGRDLEGIVAVYMSFIGDLWVS